MQRIKGSILQFRREKQKYLIYNHQFGCAHLITKKVLNIVKKYYVSKNYRDKLISKSKGDSKIDKLLRMLSYKRII